MENKMENNEMLNVKLIAEMMFDAYVKGYEAAKKEESSPVQVISDSEPKPKRKRYMRHGVTTVIVDDQGKRYTAKSRGEIEEMVLKRHPGYIAGCLKGNRPIFDIDGREYTLIQ